MKKLFLIINTGIFLTISCAKDDYNLVKVSSVSIYSNSQSIFVGETAQFVAQIIPKNAKPTSVRWTSSDYGKANIDEVSGLATGIAAGTVTISATTTDGSEITSSTTLEIRDTSLLSISLGDEKIPVEIPEEGQIATIANAPRVWGNLSSIKVVLGLKEGAIVKLQDNTFVNGSAIDFSDNKQIVFTVNFGNKSDIYTMVIPSYNAVSNPYGIYTPQHLSDVRNALTSNYKMMNDIELPPTTNYDTANDPAKMGIYDYNIAGWQPIANGVQLSGTPPKLFFSEAFSGSFNGNGFRVKNLAILNRTSNSDVGIGLFAVITNGSVLNLGVELSGIIIGTRSGTDGYTLVAGGLAGACVNSTISNCYSSGGEVSGGSAYIIHVGGLIGRSFKGIITNCYSTNKASTPGGGQTYDTCSLGTLLGRSEETTITNCYGVGSLAYIPSQGGTGESTVGALIGIDIDGTITNSYRDSNANITKNGNPFAPTNTIGTAKTLTDMRSVAFASSLGSAWETNPTKNDGLPYLKDVGIGKK